jgi:hypothetical protein
MGAKAKEYRRLATVAEQQAKAASDTAAKEAYWQIADAYNEPARLAEPQP